MKAEHRRELETNTLADRMGRAVQGVQGQSRRTFFFLLGGTLVAFFALFLVFRWYQMSHVEASQRWLMLEDGSGPFIKALATQHPETTAGKAARFQMAWMSYWEFGVKRLGVDAPSALKTLDESAETYRRLAEEVKGDPVWEPAALYAQAVIEETRAVQGKEHLDSARDLFQRVVSEHGKSAYAAQSREWLKNYDDEQKRLELQNFYQEIQVRVPRMPNPMLQGFKDLITPEKKAE